MTLYFISYLSYFEVIWIFNKTILIQFKLNLIYIEVMSAASTNYSKILAQFNRLNL